MNNNFIKVLLLVIVMTHVVINPSITYAAEDLIFDPKSHDISAERLTVEF